MKTEGILDAQNDGLLRRRRQASLGGGQQFERVTDVQIDEFTVLIQLQSLTDPDKEFALGVGFDRLEVLADRALADAERFGGAGGTVASL